MKKLWENWQRVARKIGDFQARLVLSLLYFIIIGPFALIVRWGADPLSLKQHGQHGWRPKAKMDGSPMNRAMNQF